MDGDGERHRVIGIRANSTRTHEKRERDVRAREYTGWKIEEKSRGASQPLSRRRDGAVACVHTHAHVISSCLLVCFEPGTRGTYTMYYSTAHGRRVRNASARAPVLRLVVAVLIART